MENKRLNNRREIENIRKDNAVRIGAYMAATTKEEAAAIMVRIKALNERIIELQKEERQLARKKRFNPFKRSRSLWR